MAMAEKQSEHRMYLEKTALRRQMGQSSLGQVFAFLIGLAALGAGLTASIYGHEISGSIIGGGGIIGLVTAFIQGKKQQSSSLDRKRHTT